MSAEELQEWAARVLDELAGEVDKIMMATLVDISLENADMGRDPAFRAFDVTARERMEEMGIS